MPGSEREGMIDGLMRLRASMARSSPGAPTENQRRDGCDHRILKGHSHDEVHRMVAIMTDLREVTLFKGI